MATPRSQRIGIWIIAVVLMTGTLGSFLVMGLSLNNQKNDKADLQKAYSDQQAQQKIASELNASNSEALAGYSSRTFDQTSVKSLAIEVLSAGDGAEIKSTDKINVSYFGWTSDGKIFDSSKKKSTDDVPISFTLTGLIAGWTEGLTGQKAGSVVRLTIPSDKGYGPQGSGSIPPNAPLEFIVAIHKIEG